MVIKLLIFLLILPSCNSTKKDLPEDINVLFIGNSITYNYEMPNTLQSMLNETNLNYKVSQSTYSGFSLLDHFDKIIVENTDNNVITRPKMDHENTETEKKLKSKRWDIIILQSGNFHFLIPESRDLIVNVAINNVIDVVNNPNCRIILFHNWPTKETYEKDYCYPGKFINQLLEDRLYCSPKINSLDEELMLLNSAYDEIKKRFDIEVTEHGRLFYSVFKVHPEIKLLEDTFHPSEIGSFLNACVFYEIITGKSVLNINFNGGLNQDLALLLKKTASNDL